MSAGARFNRCSRWVKGYAPAEVDAFVEAVTRRLDAAAAGNGAAVGPDEIRHVGFALVRGGYDIEAVDIYLDDLEERAYRRVGSGTRAPINDPAELVGPVLDNPPGQRFARGRGLLGRGYDVDAVDDFCDRVARALTGGRTSAAIEVEEVRSVAFHVRFRGYDEDAVDDFLDAVVDHLLTERAAESSATSG